MKELIIGTTSPRLRHFIAVAAGALITSALAAPRPLQAQEPGVLFACYVPSSGTVYRIKAPGLRQECGASERDGGSEQHVEFSWLSAGATAGTTGAGGGGKQIDHGGLLGLADDDHVQYLLAGARHSINGFAVTSEQGQGDIPVTGPGARFMWYGRKAALRAGSASGDHWDDSNIGDHSAAIGRETRASGEDALAFGPGANATGNAAVALGWGANAAGGGSAALGFGAHATGEAAVALGSSTASGQFAFSAGLYATASGDYSTAIGFGASTNGNRGAFVYSDASSGDLKAQQDNQFVVRAQRFWLGNNSSVTATAGRLIETSTGAYLSSGGAWVNSSDVARKTSFEAVAGEDVLEKLARMPIRTWRYKDEDAAVRHIGPTAQDFRAAFGLGDTDKAIASIDADGVSMAAIQALAKRTAALATLTQLVDQQEARIRDLEAQIAALRAELH